MIDAKEIWALDKKYAENGVPFHARPLRAAIELAGGDFSIGSSFVGASNLKSKMIMNTYKALVPEVEITWPGAGTGMVAVVDQVKKIVVPVVHGTCTIMAHQAFGFDDERAWWQWCRGDESIASATQYAFIDALDFSFGMESLKSSVLTPEMVLWHQAASNIEVVVDSLLNCYRTNSILQPVCMAAELSMKGSLRRLGVSEADLIKKFGHNHLKLAEGLADLSPHHEDTQLMDAAKQFPDYVASRYADAGMTRLQIIDLALKSQFVAASSLRRVSGVDETVAMATSSWPGPRK